MTITEQMVHDQLRREDEVMERLRDTETPEAFEQVASEMRDEEIRTVSIQAEWCRTLEAEAVEEAVQLHREVIAARREFEEVRERLTSLQEKGADLEERATTCSKNARAAEADRAEMLNKTARELYEHFDR